MKIIYKPKWRAGEYSPYALNVYTNCSHLCNYCYVIPMAKRFWRNHFWPVTTRKWFLEQLKKDCIEHNNKNKWEWVFLCFTTDPYSYKDVELQETRKALKILLENNIQVAILSKWWRRILRDIDLFKKFWRNIKVGQTMTFDNNKHSLFFERWASPFTERIEVFKELKNNWIATFASFEPVVSTEQSINIIKNHFEYIDWFKIWTLNHFKNLFIKNDKYTIKDFWKEAVEFLRSKNKNFFIKEDLQKELVDVIDLNAKEINPYEYYEKRTEKEEIKTIKNTLF